MELVDVPDSKSGAARRGGSSPPRGTIQIAIPVRKNFSFSLDTSWSLAYLIVDAANTFINIRLLFSHLSFKCLKFRDIGSWLVSV